MVASPFESPIKLKVENDILIQVPQTVPKRGRGPQRHSKKKTYLMGEKQIEDIHETYNPYT